MILNKDRIQEYQDQATGPKLKKYRALYDPFIYLSKDIELICKSLAGDNGKLAIEISPDNTHYIVIIKWQ